MRAPAISFCAERACTLCLLDPLKTHTLTSRVATSEADSDAILELLLLPLVAEQEDAACGCVGRGGASKS